MKFVCDACGARYHIEDSKVRGKILRIRCKQCSFVITVREPDARTAPETANGRPAGGDGAEIEWFYSLNGVNHGPFGEDDLLERYERGEIGDETYVWHADFDDWRPAIDVPVFGAAIARAVARRPSDFKHATVQLSAVDYSILRHESVALPALVADPVASAAAAAGDGADAAGDAGDATPAVPHDRLEALRRDLRAKREGHRRPTGSLRPIDPRSASGAQAPSPALDADAATALSTAAPVDAAAAAAADAEATTAASSRPDPWSYDVTAVPIESADFESVLDASNPDPSTTSTPATPSVGADAATPVAAPTPFAAESTRPRRSEEAVPAALIGRGPVRIGTTPAAGEPAAAGTRPPVFDAPPLPGIPAPPVSLSSTLSPAVDETPSASLVFQVKQAKQKTRRGLVIGLVAMLLIAIAVAYVSTRPEPVATVVRPVEQAPLRVEPTVAAAARAARDRDAAFARARRLIGQSIGGAIAALPDPEPTLAAHDRSEPLPLLGMPGDMPRAARRPAGGQGDAAPQAGNADPATEPQAAGGLRRPTSSLVGISPTTSRSQRAGQGPPPETFAEGLRTFVNNSITRCHQRQVAEEGSLPSPRIELSITVQPSGRVSTMQLNGVSNDTSFARCLQTHRERWLFPNFSGDPVTLAKTYVLQQ